MFSLDVCNIPGCHNTAAAGLELNVFNLYTEEDLWGPAPKLCEAHYDSVRNDLDALFDWTGETMPMIESEDEGLWLGANGS